MTVPHWTTTKYAEIYRKPRPTDAQSVFDIYEMHGENNIKYMQKYILKGSTLFKEKIK
jgi:hypothetical protein